MYYRAFYASSSIRARKKITERTQCLKSLYNATASPVTVIYITDLVFQTIQNHFLKKEGKGGEKKQFVAMETPLTSEAVT